MSDFKKKGSNVLVGGTTGAAVGRGLGTVVGSFGGPVTAKLGATLDGAAGNIVELFVD